MVNLYWNTTNCYINTQKHSPNSPLTLTLAFQLCSFDLFQFTSMFFLFLHLTWLFSVQSIPTASTNSTEIFNVKISSRSILIPLWNRSINEIEQTVHNLAACVALTLPHDLFVQFSLLWVRTVLFLFPCFSVV